MGVILQIRFFLFGVGLLNFFGSWLAGGLLGFFWWSGIRRRCGIRGRIILSITKLHFLLLIIFLTFIKAANRLASFSFCLDDLSELEGRLPFLRISWAERASSFWFWYLSCDPFCLHRNQWGRNRCQISLCLSCWLRSLPDPLSLPACRDLRQSSPGTSAKTDLSYVCPWWDLSCAFRVCSWTSWI